MSTTSAYISWYDTEQYLQLHESTRYGRPLIDMDYTFSSLVEAEAQHVLASKCGCVIRRIDWLRYGSARIHIELANNKTLQYAIECLYGVLPCGIQLVPLVYIDKEYIVGADYELRKKFAWSVWFSTSNMYTVERLDSKSILMLLPSILSHNTILGRKGVRITSIENGYQHQLYITCVHNKHISDLEALKFVIKAVTSIEYMVDFTAGKQVSFSGYITLHSTAFEG